MKQNKFPFSAAFRGAIGFGLGGLLVVLPIFQPLVPSVGQGTVIRLLRLLVPIALSFAGGVVGGASLRAGKKTTIGFGLGFVFPALLAQISFVAPQAWGGGKREQPGDRPLLYFVLFNRFRPSRRDWFCLYTSGSQSHHPLRRRIRLVRSHRGNHRCGTMVADEHKFTKRTSAYR